MKKRPGLAYRISIDRIPPRAQRRRCTETEKYQCKLPENTITCRSTSVLKGGIRRIEQYGTIHTVLVNKLCATGPVPGFYRLLYRYILSTCQPALCFHIYISACESKSVVSTTVSSARKVARVSYFNFPRALFTINHSESLEPGSERSE